jgi:hypothetical protein
MEDSEFEETLQKLSDQVNKFTSTTTVSNYGNTSGRGFMSKINFNSPLVYYVSIPLGIMIVLFLWKPRFITDEVNGDGEIPKQKLVVKKLLIATVILTTVVCIIIFVKVFKKTS